MHHVSESRIVYTHFALYFFHFKQPHIIWGKVQKFIYRLMNVENKYCERPCCNKQQTYIQNPSLRQIKARCAVKQNTSSCVSSMLFTMPLRSLKMGATFLFQKVTAINHLFYYCNIALGLPIKAKGHCLCSLFQATLLPMGMSKTGHRS